LLAFNKRIHHVAQSCECQKPSVQLQRQKDYKKITITTTTTIITITTIITTTTTTTAITTITTTNTTTTQDKTTKTNEWKNRAFYLNYYE